MLFATTLASVAYVAFRKRGSNVETPLSGVFDKVTGVSETEVLPTGNAVVMKAETGSLKEVEKLAEKHGCFVLPRAVWLTGL